MTPRGTRVHRGGSGERSSERPRVHVRHLPDLHQESASVAGTAPVAGRNRRLQARHEAESPGFPGLFTLRTSSTLPPRTCPPGEVQGLQLSVTLEERSIWASRISSSIRALTAARCRERHRRWLPGVWTSSSGTRMRAAPWFCSKPRPAPVRCWEAHSRNSPPYAVCATSRHALASDRYGATNLRRGL